jgi:hypothetical protein
MIVQGFFVLADIILVLADIIFLSMCKNRSATAAQTCYELCSSPSTPSDAKKPLGDGRQL